MVCLPVCEGVNEALPPEILGIDAPDGNAFKTVEIFAEFDNDVAK